MSAARGLHHLYGRGTAEGLMYLASGTFVDWMFVTYRQGGKPTAIVYLIIAYSRVAYPL